MRYTIICLHYTYTIYIVLVVCVRDGCRMRRRFPRRPVVTDYEDPILSISCFPNLTMTTKIGKKNILNRYLRSYNIFCVQPTVPIITIMKWYNKVTQRSVQRVILRRYPLGVQECRRRSATVVIVIL